MKKIIVTIDTEGHMGQNPIEKLIFGNTKDGQYGIGKIMDEFEKKEVKILFFVDFAEAWDYGEDRIKQVIDYILLRGHDIGVHIHPDHMADKNRLFMWEYSYEEQNEMIYKCTELYKKMVGKNPLSFRAGKYSADYNTLDILCKYGYKYDFSEYYGQKWCGIKPPVTINAPVRYKDIVEFPVTMHRSIKILGYSRYDKIDIESMLSKELEYALQQVSIQKFQVVVTLFMHSFSLLEWVKDPDNPVKSKKKINKLKRAIRIIEKIKNFDFISEADLIEILPEKHEVASVSEINWNSKFKGIFYSYQKLRFIAKRNIRARLLLNLIRVITLIMCGIIIFVSFH